MTAAQGALGLGIVLTLRDEVSNRLKQLRDKVTDFQGVSKDMVDRFDAGSKKILAGVGLIYGGAKLLSKSFSQPLAAAMGFQSGMAEVGTLIDGNVRQMKMLGDAALVLSARYGKSANEIASATYQAISAGVDASKASSFVETASKMAVAGVTDTKIAVDGLTSAMKAYNRTEEEAMDISDSFFVAMKYGKTTVGELSGIMGKVASSAAQAKIPFDEMMAAVAAATLPGQATAEVGTGMVAVIKALVAPTSEAQKAAKELGVELNETALKSKGLLGMFQQLMEKTGGSQEKLTKLLGSTEAMKTMLNAMSGDGQNFIMILDEMAKKSGATEAAFKTISETVQFKLGVLEHTFNSVRIKFGTLLLPVFGKIVDGLTVVANWMNALPQPVLAVVAAALGFVGAGLILLGVLLTIGGVIKMWPFIWAAAKASLKSLGESTQFVTRGLNAITSASLKLRLSMLGLIVIGVLAYRMWKNNFGGIRDLVFAVTAGFKMAFAAGRDGIAKVDAATAKKLRELGLWDFAVTAGKVFFRVRSFFWGLIEGFKEGFQQWKEVLASIAAFFDPVIENGKQFLGLIGLWDGAASSNSKTWGEWGKNLGAILGTFGPLILGIVAAVKAVILVTKIWNAVTAMNPLLWIPIVIVGLIALMIYKWDYFGSYVTMVFQGIWGVVSGFCDFFIGIVQMIAGIFTGNLDLIEQGFLRTFGGLADFLIGWVKIVGGILAPIRDGINWVLEKLGIVDSKRHNEALAKSVAGLDVSEEAKRDLVGTTAALDPDTARRVNERIHGLPENQRGDERAVYSILEEERARRVDPKAAPLAATSMKSASLQAARANERMAQAGQVPLSVDNKVDVEVKPAKTEVYIDGTKVGEAVTRYQDRQNVRKGRG